MEIWKDVVGYEESYQISSLGNVRSKDRFIKRGNSGYWLKGKVMTPYPNSKGYLRVCLVKNNTEKNVFVHRLVAQAFIPNPNNYPIINHKDENCINNCVENLEWCTYSYNNTYNDLHHRKMKNYNWEERNKKVDYKRINKILMQFRMKKVYQYDLEGNLIKEWESGAECIRAGVATKTMYCCIFGRQKTHRGYVWSHEKK